MNADRIPDCEQGLAAAILSQWRDGALSDTEARQFEQHVAACIPCREQLADYASLAEGLRAIHVPDPVGGYGQNPRLLTATSRRAPTRLSRLARLGSLGAVAAVLLTVAAFAHLLVPRDYPQLSWQARQHLPGGINLTYPTGDLAIAPTDGATAYACSVAANPTGNGAMIQVWVTHDGAGHWTLARSISDEQGATECIVAADSIDPSIAVVSSADAFGTAAAPSHSAGFVTFDGSVTWQQLAGMQVIRQLATSQGMTYAILEEQAAANIQSPIQTDLAVSRDGMRTWTTIDQAIDQAPTPQTPRTFWLNPGSGAVLVQTEDLSTGDFYLWTSQDVGQHWTELSRSVQVGSFVVQAPSAGQPWRICAASYDPTRGHDSNMLSCSSDGGRTWASRAALNVVVGKASGKSTTAAPTLESNIFALADDGAVLATVGSERTSAAAPTLYRLPAGADGWQALGPIPEPLMLYASAPGHGVLWAVPTGVTTPDPQHRIFAATYP